MEKIRFETSIGTFECEVINNHDIQVPAKNYWKLKKHLDFHKIYIYNETWIKIELSDPFYGSPEYKYEIIE